MINRHMYYTAIFAALVLQGCSSAPKNTASGNDFEADKVVARMDQASARPAWLKEGEPFRIEGGQVLVLGQTTLPAEDRVEAGYRIAANNAKGAIAGAIEQRLEFIFQNAEEGTGMSATQARYIGAEASKLTTSAMRLDKRYWEKVAVSQSSGQRSLQLHVYTQIVMPEADFKRAIMDAIKKQQGGKALSAEFAKKVDQQWDRFASEEAQPNTK